MEKWLFIDYTAITDINQIDLSDFSKLILFIPQSTPSFEFACGKYSKPINFQFISVPDKQINSISLLMAFYLGQYHASASSDTEFYFVSHFASFSTLQAHLSLIERTSVLIHGDELRKPSKINVVKVALSSEEKAATEKVLLYLEDRPIPQRPNKTKSMKNTIKSINQQLTSKQIDKIFKLLSDNNIIFLNGDKVSYEANPELNELETDIDFDITDYENIPF